MKFIELNLPKPILRALSEQGYETPTPIQAKAIPPALEGRDVLGCARTGTGKTCAFATPILTCLNQNPRNDHPIRALVLTPTRELALQNQECFVAYGAYLPLRSTVIFGGVGQNPQVEALQKGTDILVATPGRLADLYQQGYIDLTQLEIFVLDEADRMLDMGFIHDVKKILQWLPEKKQTLFFSATMPNEVQKLVNQLLHDPVRIAVDPVNSTVDAIDQNLYRTDKGKKIKLLTWLLRERDYPSVLVFTRTKHGANRVARDLEKAGITAAAIHGNKSQTARQAALADFKSGKLRVLVATDIAARGLDIEGLACVVNYNLPDVPETYVHRIGRTGRAGQAGIALSFCDVSELEDLAAIEKQLKKPIPTVETHPYPMEELEVPMKDSRGRKINTEDAEARAAAREQSQKRREKLRTMAEQAKGQAKEQAEPAAPKADGTQERKNRPAKNRKERPAKPSAAANEPVLKPEEDVGSYADWVKYRSSTRQPERKP
ncbi:MAG: DEAD/DEAH box helicase, partial [Oscillospiraceae bacterium]|nr:DEAD/DEAH box helicase [Oscillospiraceae bacterium]